jgi:endo-alpha-1,4-polygalactosaminidase (GH114 family)
LRDKARAKFVHDVTWAQVPSGPHKKELLENLDRVPTYVQQLQFTVKNPTVGKAATFTKVDNVIQETKNLMNVISKVVTTCFDCATKVSRENARYAFDRFALRTDASASSLHRRLPELLHEFGRFGDILVRS